ncbi:MAG: periplasmic heavy metal sensor [Candidatus Margulisiibacteriota bacterium]
MKKSFAVGIVAAALAVFLSSSSMAAWGEGSGKGWGRGGSPSFCKGKIASRLKLSQDQINKSFEKEQSVERDILAKMQENEKIRLAMGQELKNDNPGKAKLYKFIDDINKNRAESQKKRIEYILWFKSQLTPEQKQKFASCFNGKGLNRKQGKGFGWGK